MIEWLRTNGYEVHCTHTGKSDKTSPTVYLVDKKSKKVVSKE